MIHTRIDLSAARDKSIGTFNPDGTSPQIWFMAEGVTVPEEPGEIQPEAEEESLLLCLSLSDAAALSTLLQQSILECVNGRGRVN